MIFCLTGLEVLLASAQEKQELNNSRTPLLIGGGVVVISLALMIGYLVGKRGKVVSE